jgi:hypothetical protein
MLAQQSYYPQSATPSHEYYSPQSVPMGAVPGHEAAPAILPQNVPVPVTSPIHMQHAHHPHPHQQQQHHHQQQQQHHQQQQQQQQYMQMIQQQQRYEQTPRTNYIPAAYEQPPFQGQQMTPEQPMMVTYHPNYAYKPPGPRILNQSEGTDWGFLGVG